MRRLEVAAELAALAHRLARLRPSHRDPELYHVEKNEIETTLRRLARHIEETRP